MPEQFEPRKTRASREAADAAPVYNTTAYSPTGTEVVETPPQPAYDWSSVTPEERKEWGIEDNKAIGWIRNPKIWEKHEKSDRLREAKREHPGLAPVTDGTGELVTLDDLILVKYPIEQKEANEAAELKAYDDYVYGEVEDTKSREKQDLARMARDRHRENVSSGITGEGSPTRGQELRDVYSRKTKEEIFAEEKRFRQGDRQQSFNDDDWGKMLDSQSDRPRQGGTRATFSMGDSGFGRNPKSAVAQAARKGKG